MPFYDQCTAESKKVPKPSFYLRDVGLSTLKHCQMEPSFLQLTFALPTLSMKSGLLQEQRNCV